MTRLGIDFGGVITNRLGNDGTDTAFKGSNYMATTAVNGSFKAISALVGMLRPENVFIISKCGEETERKTKSWLEGHAFYGYTKLLPENVLFCRERHEKAPIANELELTHFVDDRSDVLRPMEGTTVLYRLLFGPQEEDTSYNGLYRAETWRDALTIVGNTHFLQTRRPAING